MRMVELKNRALSFDRATEVSPLYVGEAPIQKKVDGFKVIWNTDKDEAVTVVSNRYNLVQHEEVVSAVADAIQNLNISANARVRNGGNRIFVDIEFDNAKLYVKEVGEEFIGGIRVINSYDRTTGIIVAPRLLRLSCSNGMVVQHGFIKGYNIKHTAKLEKDFQATIELMVKDMIDNNDKLKALVNDCIGDSIEWELMEKILKSVSGAKKHFEAIKEILDNDSKSLHELTRWDLYNAFTNYATHGEQLSPNVENLMQKKAERILLTPLVELVPQQNN